MIIEGDIVENYECTQDKIPLLQGLKDYSNKHITCFDVPGHVKNKGVKLLNKFFGDNLMKMDINSSPNMDNVSNPSGVIKKSQELFAQAYDCDKAFFVTNGTTQAIQAMILSVINPDDKILLPRNIHKSVINALILSGGKPVYIQPEFYEEFGISLNVSYCKVKEALEKNSDIKAIFLLNPTYYGACCDLEKIIKLCKKYSVLVLIDEAHGAHFPFHDNLPPSAMKLQADMAAVSMHKTGGALTQASALLLNTTNISEQKVRQTINMLQSTSASYLLMSSLDGARYNMVNNGEKQLTKALNLSKYAKLKLNQIPGIRVINHNSNKNTGLDFIDETKLCINVKGLNITGFRVYDILYQDFDIQVELGDLYNILALVSIGTTKDDIDRLIDALEIISKKFKNENILGELHISQINPIVKMNPRNAYYGEKESIELEDSVNRICGENIMAYPPGIPIISPGEIITAEILDYIRKLKENNAYLTDMQDKELKKVLVIKEK